MEFKYNLQLVRERENNGKDVFEKAQKILGNGKYDFSQIIPTVRNEINNYIAYAKREENYNIALSVEKFKNDRNIPKEKVLIQGTDYMRDSKLIEEIIGDLK